jgi:hypothetical protein
VLGFANGPSTYSIAVTQLLPNGSPNANGGTRTSGTSTTGGAGTPSPISGLFRFTVNPVLKKVTVSIVN